MAKINVINNEMAMFMICESAIGEDGKRIKFHPDKNGIYDVKITLNGVELNTERFLKRLMISNTKLAEKKAYELLHSEYDKMLQEIYSIQGALEEHKKKHINDDFEFIR